MDRFLLAVAILFVRGTTRSIDVHHEGVEFSGYHCHSLEHVPTSDATKLGEIKVRRPDREGCDDPLSALCCSFTISLLLTVVHPVHPTSYSFRPRQISYSFEIVSARLVRPPKRPTSGRERNCRETCTPGKACDCGVGDGVVMGGIDNRLRAHGAKEDVAVEGEEERQGAAHYGMHMGVNDVATLVLEDNQGITYDFYTFQVTFRYITVNVFVLSTGHVV